MLLSDFTVYTNGESQFSRYQWVALQQIPETIQLAVIASEDQLFPEHWGIDIQATSAAIKAELKGSSSFGGSTITQQVAKNLFLWHGRSYVRKALEWFLAGLIDLLWSKQRILEVYLNIAQFGPHEYGVQAASEFLFKKPLDKLSDKDAVLLAAVLPAPSRYHIAKPSTLVQKRQKWILRQMRQLGGVNYLQKIR